MKKRFEKSTIELQDILNKAGVQWVCGLSVPRDDTGTMLHPAIGFDNYDVGVKIVDRLSQWKEETWPDAGPELVFSNPWETLTYRVVEKEIINHVNQIPCDILRVGHHGSNTSTSEAWIKYLKPKEAVISVGKNNKFGHPSKSVVDTLNKYRIPIRRTDLEGTITYKELSF